MWGCPVYVLKDELQDDKKIQKWDPRARLGMFVRFSPVHFSLVPVVLNVRTGKISPQYHVVFGDKFSTINSLSSDKSLDAQWSCIFNLNRELYLDLEYDQVGHLKTSQFPDLDSKWLDPVSSSTTGLSVPGGAYGADAAPRGASRAPLQRSPRLNINSACRGGQAPASVAGSSLVPSGYHEGTKVRKPFIANQPILQDTWDDVDGKCFCNFSR